jgi:hypothetical protein
MKNKLVIWHWLVYIEGKGLLGAYAITCQVMWVEHE